MEELVDGEVRRARRRGGAPARKAALPGRGGELEGLAPRRQGPRAGLCAPPAPRRPAGGLELLRAGGTAAYCFSRSGGAPGGDAGAGPLDPVARPVGTRRQARPAGRSDRRARRLDRRWRTPHLDHAQRPDQRRALERHPPYLDGPGETGTRGHDVGGGPLDRQNVAVIVAVPGAPDWPASATVAVPWRK